VPLVREEELKLATPDFNDAVNRKVLLPSMKVTVPVGVPEPGDLAETVAVKVTNLPNLEGLEDDLIAVAVAALLTVCIRGADVLLSKLVLPLKVAVME